MGLSQSAPQDRASAFCELAPREGGGGAQTLEAAIRLSLTAHGNGVKHCQPSSKTSLRSVLPKNDRALANALGRRVGGDCERRAMSDVNLRRLGRVVRTGCVYGLFGL
jgi:hypothetical protein